MSKEAKSVLERGPSGGISDGNYNTKIQIALLEYFNSHGFNIKDPIMIQLLTNIMEYTRGEKTSTSGKDADGEDADGKDADGEDADGEDADGYYMGLQKFKDNIVNAHRNCKLVTGLKNLLLSDDNNHYEKLQQLKEAYEALKHKIKENNTEIKRLQSGINKLQKKRSEGSRSNGSRKVLEQDIADKTEQVKEGLVKKTKMDKVLEDAMDQMKLLIQAIENQIKQLEKFIYLMLIITIIYDKSVLHLLIAGPLFSYQDGNTHSTKIREGIGKKHGLLGRCNQKLLDLESTLQVVEAIYQLREIIDSGNGITNKQIDAFVSGINKRGAPPEVTRDIETLKQVIRLCTIRGNFVNFDPFSQEVKQGSLKKKRTHRKKTNRKKTNRKKTQHKKTNRKKTQHKKTQHKKTNRKKSKKSVKTGGSGLSDDNVANIIIGVFVVLLFAGTPVLLAMLEAFVITILVNLVVFLINGFRSICCGGEEEDSQRSRGRRGSHEIQETSSGRQRRIIRDQKRNSQPLHPSLLISVKKLIDKHDFMKAARREEAEAARGDPPFMLKPTVSGQRDLDLNY